MHLRFFIVILLFASSALWAQVDFGCLTVDFETLPGGAPSSGVLVSDQFQASFGVTFSLETGGSPVLAEVGFPLEAFLSGWGQDEPRPGVDIGRFFLTDDGQLSGSESPPIVLTFDIPIDTFGGCILDMDGGEMFTIEARDASGNIVLEETLRAGDPGTGDGMLTCWGFNLPGCEGVIKTITYRGTRTDGGGFGLGMDNFSFCYTAAPLEAIILPETCNGLGSVDIVTGESTVGYSYSLNGEPFIVDGFWDNLVAGVYDIRVRDPDGCETEIPAFVVDFVAPAIRMVESENTTCGDANGRVVIDAGDTQGAQYSLDDITYQDSNVFDSLAPGVYTFYVKDSFDCVVISDAIIDSSSNIEVLDFSTSVDSCDYGKGTISIISNSENGGITYRLEELDQNLTGYFENLSSGTYSIAVTDSIGCEEKIEVDVSNTPGVLIPKIEASAPSCYEANGYVEFSLAGGVGELTAILLDSMDREVSFEGLNSGLYTILVTDEYGCIAFREITIDTPYCPIYVPNIISKQELDPDKLFRISTKPGYQVEVIRYSIYDRWGELVFLSENFNIHSDDSHFWDGRFRGKDALQGVYTYLIEVDHPNGEYESITGTVMLLR